METGYLEILLLIFFWSQFDIAYILFVWGNFCFCKIVSKDPDFAYQPKHQQYQPYC